MLRVGKRLAAVCLVLGMGALAGCEGTAPDVNPGVFHTVDEVVEGRRAHQRRIWKEGALAVLRMDRPDVRASVAEGFAVEVEADGVRRVIDLSEALEALSAQPGRSQQILREHLELALPAFDRARLAAVSWTRARAWLRPMLVGDGELAALRERHGVRGGKSVGGGLSWIVVARQEGTEVRTPVGGDVLAAWQVEETEAERVALENLRREVREGLFETMRFGPAGRVGQLRPEADAAVVLLPDFLGQVREEWGMSDDLVVLLGAGGQAQFLEERNRELLEMIYPAWRQGIAQNPEALARRALLLSDEGLTLLADEPLARLTPMPTTLPGIQSPLLRQPTTRPTLPQLTTQPVERPYIAR